MTTRVTEVQIIPIKPKDGLVAFASVVLDDKLYLGSIGIYTKLDGNGYRLTFPTKQSGERSFNLYYPINSETYTAIEAAIIIRFEEVTERRNDHDRHDRPGSAV